MKMNSFIWGLVGLAVGLIIGWIIVQPKTLSTNIPGSPATQTQGTVSSKQLDFIMGMRKLWEDHITWTRMYIVSAIADNEDKDNVAQRLLKNQEDLGNAIKSFYGETAGNKLTDLLKTHITTAVTLIDAAKNNDQNALNDANTKWYQNADEIADFLSAANPNLGKDEMRAMMKEHLDLTKQEAIDIISKKFDEDIADYDKIHTQILGMSDTLSSAIIKQFPDKF